MLSLERFDIFRAIVDNRSLAGAARALGTSRAVVSFNLRRLEEELGVPLIVRNTRGLTLTDAGARFYEGAGEALDAARRAVDDARGDQSDLRGNVRVTTTPEYAIHAVVDWVVAFKRMHPGVHVHLATSTTAAALIPERYDFAIRLGALVDSDYRAVQLHTYGLVLCAAPSLLDAFRVTNVDDPETILALPRIGYPRIGDQLAVAANGSQVSFPTGVAGSVMSVDQASTLLGLAAAGVGVAILPDWLARPHISEGELVPVLRTHQFGMQAVSAVYAGGRHLPRHVRALIEFIRTRSAA
jgi:DNA-binding transcriptional LysR family regulator